MPCTACATATWVAAHRKTDSPRTKAPLARHLPRSTRVQSSLQCPYCASERASPCACRAAYFFAPVPSAAMPVPTLRLLSHGWWSAAYAIHTIRYGIHRICVELITVMSCNYLIVFIFYETGYLCPHNTIGTRRPPRYARSPEVSMAVDPRCAARTERRSAPARPSGRLLSPVRARVRGNARSPRKSRSRGRMDCSSLEASPSTTAWGRTPSTSRSR